MKQKIILVIMLLSCIGLFADRVQPLGTGTGSDPYQIISLNNLEWVSSNPSSWNSYFVQLNDIDAYETADWDGGHGWTPIGNGSTKFSGDYDGDGHTVSGITCDRESSYQGFFGWIKEGDVHDLGLIDVDISGTSRVGGLSGAGSYNFDDATVYNCYATGTVTGSGDEVGGLIGWDFRCQITDSYADCTVSGNESVGGLVGLITNNTVIDRSYSKGSVSGSTDVGGLVGASYSAYVSDSYSMASCVGSVSYLGGLIGHIYYTNNINKCYATNSFNGNATDKGGLIGGSSYGDSDVNSSFWNLSNISVSFAGTGKYTSQLNNINTFTYLNTDGLDDPWDFVGNPNDDAQNNDYWNIDSTKDNGYPFLSWQTFPPDIPTNVIISVYGNDIKLVWDNMGATSYSIYRSNVSNPTNWSNAIGSSNVNSYTDTNAATGTKYFYHITSKN